MPLELRDCKFQGHALPAPFAHGDLEAALLAAKLLPRATGPEGKQLDTFWQTYRRKLRSLGEHSGPVSVRTHVLEPLITQLGYAKIRKDDAVLTREGSEDGGWVFETADGKTSLRAWAIDVGADFDAPRQRSQAYRYSPTQIAQRVLLARGERIGLLTDGNELRLLFCDPARRESHVAIELGRAGGWRGANAVPDSYRLVVALTRPEGVVKVADIVEQARLQQTRVTKTLREQARYAVRDFVQALLDDPANAAYFAEYTDKQKLSKGLFKDALVIVYRLLFVLKLESSSDPERSFSFASTSLWRNTYSPSHALADIVKHVRAGAETGDMLSSGLRALFRMFREGFQWSEMRVTRLGGMLFGDGTAPLLDDPELRWSERAAGKLLDHLLWTPGGKRAERERVHYGPLSVEDLGRVYEALLELEPGMATEPMCRLRRQKLEVVVPAAQGAAYRQNVAPVSAGGVDADADDEAELDDEESEKPAKGKTRVEWIEDIPAGSFYLRVGLGRKATGSYYTPEEFVRFLIQETLGPQVEAGSPKERPDPGAILALKVLDPAMGSGHFLVEACRYLGEALYEACRACDTKAEEAERAANGAETAEQRSVFIEEAAAWRKRVVDLPDPNDELLAYLPSRASGGETDVRSQGKAQAICRRLVAVHCLYGVDKNPLAVELAKLSLWLESYAEGLPLTFLDHRLLWGDSLTGPFFDKLLTLPKDGGRLDDLFSLRLTDRLTGALGQALVHVGELEASIGKDEADIVHKREAKAKLDAALKPFKLLSAAWSGAVMLGDSLDDDYRALVLAVSEGRDTEEELAKRPGIAKAVEVGKAGVSYDLVFPEVFWPKGKLEAGERAGFHAVVGNPPWDAVHPLAKEFFAAFDLRILDAPTRLERAAVERRLTADPEVKEGFRTYVGTFDATKLLFERLYNDVNRVPGGGTSGAVTDLWQPFAERGATNLRKAGRFGMVLPSAFHANQSGTGIRDLFLRRMAIVTCFSFENSKRLFDIHASFKFALLTAERNIAATESFACAFYLHDLDWLFGSRECLTYTRAFVEKTGGDYLTMMELRSEADAAVAQVCFGEGELLGGVRSAASVNVGRELHMTDDAYRFTPSTRVGGSNVDPREPSVAINLLADGYVPLHEGKTFHQYNDRWGDRPRYLVALSAIADKPSWKRAAQFFRLAFRDIASSTNERTGIFGMLPPGVLCGNKAPCEREPFSRPNRASLNLLAVANSFPFDYVLRFKVQATVNLFILDACPVPPSAFTLPCSRFLAHSALRLSCNHNGYAPLWTEQLGEDTWREPTPKYTWPVLADDDARWTLRAAVDAVVAEAYGLSRDQYTHVLASFNHKTYPKAAEKCLAAFDELKTLGIDAFTRKHDPYADIPLVDTLPQPVITYPAAPAGSEPEKGQVALIPEAASKKRGRKPRN